LADPDLVARFAAIVARHDLGPDRIQLEITESVLMDDAEFAAGVLEALRAAGFRLAVDDFGTGYSSLAYLRRFPVDLLKVDRSFVDGVSRDPGDAAIARAVVTLAHSLGLQAVAEGVETTQQLDTLSTLGCDAGQGFLWSRPIPSEDFQRYLVDSEPGGV
jgi:EAL domain-containing protein (putative c-di-GMP-specific phosphodiesterase class I)